MGEEILNQFNILSGNAHQVTCPPAYQIGRRELIQLTENVDPHLGQQSKSHVVSYP